MSYGPNFSGLSLSSQIKATLSCLMDPKVSSDTNWDPYRAPRAPKWLKNMVNKVLNVKDDLEFGICQVPDSLNLTSDLDSPSNSKLFSCMAPPRQMPLSGTRAPYRPPLKVGPQGPPEQSGYSKYDQMVYW